MATEHEMTHVKQVGLLKLAAAACSLVSSCRHLLELDAYEAEGELVDRKLTDLQARKARAPLTKEEQTSERVLKETKKPEQEFFRNPSLLDRPE